MALCKLVKLAAVSGVRFSNYSTYVGSCQISQLAKSNGNRVILLDTLQLVRSLEAKGVSSKQAEVITAALMEVLKDSLENISDAVASKAEMQKIEIVQEANLSKFKSEFQISQEHHFSMQRREAEKFRSDMERMLRKLSSDLRCELKKSTNKLETTIHAVTAEIEIAKNDVIKYFMGTCVFVSAIGLATV